MASKIMGRQLVADKGFPESTVRPDFLASSHSHGLLKAKEIFPFGEVSCCQIQGHTKRNLRQLTRGRPSSILQPYGNLQLRMHFAGSPLNLRVSRDPRPRRPCGLLGTISDISAYYTGICGVQGSLLYSSNSIKIAFFKAHGIESYREQAFAKVLYLIRTRNPDHNRNGRLVKLGG
ncbi:unnamed protein product [Sphagnum balticum]